MFATLPGFRVFYPEDSRRRSFLFSTWRQCAKAFAFREYDGPALEPLELYTAKSGDEIVGQLFAFEDKGGRQIALRPEMTPTLARLVGEKANSLPRPIKWFSIGDQYRYERPQKGRLRAFTQFNADILGEPGVAADAELIGLLVKVFTQLGFSAEEVEIRLSDRDLWTLMLEEAGFAAQSEEILRIVDRLDKVAREKTREALAEVVGDQAESLLKRIEKLRELGSLAEIRTFFAGSGALEGRLAAWGELLERLEAMALSPFIRIDLGIVRGLAYYTGFVFEAFSRVGAGRALAGGGRYDHLVEKLGFPALPAVGFAIGDVTLGDLLDELERWPPLVESIDAFLVVGDDAYRSSAWADLSMLRGHGVSADMSLREAGFGKQMKQASAAGACFALLYGSEELEKQEVTVKDLASGHQVSIPRAQLLPALLSFRSDGFPRSSEG